MSRFFLILNCLVFTLLYSAAAQETFSENGVQDSRKSTYVITGAKVFKTPTTVIDNASIIVKEGKIVDIGNSLTVPESAIKVDLQGMTIYPGFIDLYAHIGLPEVKRSSLFTGKPEQLDEQRKGAYGWNEAIKADYHAVFEYEKDDKQAKVLRSQGFTTVLTHRPDGVIRGTGALVLLNDRREEETILMDKASMHYSFSKGSSSQEFPATVLGASALIRQTFLDAEWYDAGGDADFYDQNLLSFNESKGLPSFIESNNRHQALLGASIGKEFGKNFILKGKGDEYQRLEELKKVGNRIIVPLNFPKEYEVSDPFDALNISLARLKHWELAPYNLSFLKQAGIPFTLTTSGMQDQKSFFGNLRKAVQKGLSEEAALAALTTIPASWIGAEKMLGKIEKGYVANFVICEGSVFDEGSSVMETWVGGERYIHKDVNHQINPGVYSVTDLETINSAEIKKGKSSYKFSFKKDTIEVKSKATYKEGTLTSTFSDSVSTWSLHAEYVDGSFNGFASFADGTWKSFSMEYDKVLEEEERPEEKPEDDVIPDIIYPFVAYGSKELPLTREYIFKNATVWTNEEEGILENTDVWVKDGKIHAVGQNLGFRSAIEIDAKGKHLTTGIIDEHSHIALFAVNEWTQAVTAEVQMKDAINPDNIHIYRQLAGGVTTSQLLHGSSNPIGGQSAIIKLKWGRPASDMLVDGAAPFIKFALGENVKQSNRFYYNTVRYPQTRMGVEQIIVDGFERARQYEKKWASWNALTTKEKAGKTPPRKDLELEALSQIMQGKRFITCHSYVQSEVNMLMKVAEQYGFRVNTFTHILEGYKVADKMAAHGSAGSTFSDWWAYKYEVKDAIPYNAALMTEAGVLASVNSDDAEMGRRLNQEAAKSIKYGGLSQEEAWKLATLNPAIMLHLDEHLGSIKVGKDADLVLWSDNPLSIYAKAEKTMIEGAIYFDIEKDANRDEWIANERQRIIHKMLNKGNANAANKQKVAKDIPGNFHCEDEF